MTLNPFVLFFGFWKIMPHISSTVPVIFSGQIQRHVGRISFVWPRA
jgi:hypothetical protein